MGVRAQGMLSGIVSMMLLFAFVVITTWQSNLACSSRLALGSWQHHSHLTCPAMLPRWGTKILHQTSCCHECEPACQSPGRLPPAHGVAVHMSKAWLMPVSSLRSTNKSACSVDDMFWDQPFDKEGTVSACEYQWGVTPRFLWPNTKCAPKLLHAMRAALRTHH